MAAPSSALRPAIPLFRSGLRAILAAGFAVWAISTGGAAAGQSPSTPGQAATVPIFGGGGEIPAPTDRLSESERQEIQRQLDRNIADLLRTGEIAPPKAAAVQLGWLLEAAATLTDYGYYGISNFVDHNPAYPNQLLDYECSSRTYDLSSGYNHAGTDYFTWPFGWLKLTNSQVRIVAAAAGTIVGRSDGNYDRSCTFNSGNWNAVYVRHADGSIAWYGHMKSGSPTPKPIGGTVGAGEYLGVVGSSGSSTGPHLHFELYDANGVLVDPYHGTCNPLPSGSWWQVQRPYRDSAVNAVTVGSAAVAFGTCPNDETPNTRTTFSTGSTIYFTTYYRDQVAGQVSTYTIRRPDGSVYYTWSHTSPYTYDASWWYRYW